MQHHFRFWVGMDWAKDNYQICVINSQRDIISEQVVDHNGSAISNFLTWLTKLSNDKPALIALSIEMPHGALVESLIERGFAVFSINPKQMDRFRDRFSVAGSKDDRLDALVLADSLRTDEHCFHRIQTDDPWTIQLREWSRAEQDTVEDINRAMNQFRQLLHRYFPQLLTLSPSADEPWLWELLEAGPTPQEAAKLKPTRIRKILSKHRIRRCSAEEVQEQLRTSPLRLAPGSADAISKHALLLLPKLRLLTAQRKNIATQIQQLLETLSKPEPGQPEQHRDAKILLSCPGVGRIIAATMLAEASEAIRNRDYHALRGYAGAAPITRRSGKQHIVIMRKACNPRLRDALYHWARVASMHEPRCKEQYSQMRQKGQTHGRALRGIGDRLLHMLIAMLNHGDLYQVDRRTPQTIAA